MNVPIIRLEVERAAFLEGVRRYIEKDPEAAAHIADYTQAGLRAALHQAYERAADMEVALSVLATKRYKGADALVRQKLEKWEGKTALRWDWLTHTGMKTPNANVTGLAPAQETTK